MPTGLAIIRRIILGVEDREHPWWHWVAASLVATIIAVGAWAWMSYAGIVE